MFWRKAATVETTDAVEVRATDYDAAIVAAILTQARGGSAGVPSATGALEGAAGLVGRSFAAAEVSAPDMMTPALTPQMLQTVGRELIRRGESVWLIATDRGSLSLLPAVSCTVAGGPYKETWRYDLSIAGPSTTLQYTDIPSESVLHFQYAVSPGQPWKGIGPLAIASLAGKLSANTIAALADETGGPVGSFLPLPIQVKAQVDGIKADVRTAKGNMLAVESGDLGNAGQTPQMEWTQRRFGASPPAALVALLTEARHEVWAAIGIHAALFDAGDSAALREAWRFALFGLLSPLGRLAQSEMQNKLDAGIKLDWTDLRASDLAGRARSFASMVNGGMPIAEAAALAGLMVPE